MCMTGIAEAVPCDLAFFSIDVRIVINKILALLKLIRVSQTLFPPDGHVSSSIGVATCMKIIVSALVPLLKAMVGSRYMALTDSTFDFCFRSQRAIGMPHQ